MVKVAPLACASDTGPSTVMPREVVEAVVIGPDSYP